MSNNPYNDNFVSGGYFYNPFNRDLTMVKGDTLSFAFQIQGLGGKIPDSIFLTVKKTIETESPLFNIYDGDTIRLRSYDEESDIFTYVVRIPPYLTADLELGRYYYDLEIQINEDTLTLMKGRFTLDYEITSGDPLPPIYENGDDIRYPIEVDLGVLKLYTEAYISNIGQAIHDINGLDRLYNTREMTDALEDIKDEIDAIRAALAERGFDPDIPLDEIPEAIGQLAFGYIHYDFNLTFSTYTIPNI